MSYKKKTVEAWLDEVDYNFVGYIPSEYALLFVNFIKAVNDGGEENESPIVHLKMMDTVFNGKRRCAILCHRGIGKTSLFSEYLILFVAAFGHLPGFGEVSLGIYVSDSIENGVKNLRRNIEYRYSESDYLKQMIPNKNITYGSEDLSDRVSSDGYESAVTAGRKFTDMRLEFVNYKGKRLVMKMYGSKTGVRGAKELGQRPQFAILDDLVSDTDAESASVISTIENTVYKAVSKALHPKRQKIIWLGTPFNQRDPLYKAVESGAWEVAVFPVCERFPATREEFRGSWEDRFDYEYVLAEYMEAQALGKPENFNQELMLRIMSDEDRLIQDHDIKWYRHADVLQNLGRFNIYITTDFTTSAKQKADYAVVNVWAVNHKGWFFWVDGTLKKQTIDKTLDDLFRLAQQYQPLSVGIEVSGQQSGFVKWIEKEMITRQVYFNIASDKNTGEPGLRPTTDKLVRFMVAVPWFKSGKMFFPEEMKDDICLQEATSELSLASRSGLKSRNDDFIDTISQLTLMDIWLPSDGQDFSRGRDNVYADEYEEDESDFGLQSYIVNS